MRASAFVGRVGGLAIALGVATGATTGVVGVAAAAPSDDASSTADQAPTAPNRSGQGSRVGPRARGGAADPSEPPRRGRRHDVPQPAAAERPAPPVKAPPEPADPPTRVEPGFAQPVVAPPPATATAALRTRSADPIPPAAVPLTAAPPAAATESAPVLQAAAPRAMAARAVGSVQSVPVPVSTSGPGSPAESTMGWTVLAAVRRLGRPEVVAAPAATVSTGQTLTPAPAATTTNVFGNRTPTMSPVQSAQGPTGVISGNLNVADADGDAVTLTVNKNPAHGTVKVDSAGRFVYTPDKASAHTGVTDNFTVTVSDAGSGFHLHLLGTSGHTATRTVTVTVTPVNAAPTATLSTGSPAPATGVVTGRVTGADADGDPLSYKGSVSTAKGAVAVSADGGFTYTPTATARHNASALTATAADKSDSFTVTVTDSYGASTNVAVAVPVTPVNAAPTGSATAGAPNPSTGAVAGGITATDPDRDTLIYRAPATTAKGTVALGTNGGFTYTPTAKARHAAAFPQATQTDKTDAFNVTVSDGHGGSVAVPVSVAVAPANALPTGSVTVANPDPASGAVTGSVAGKDADGDPLTYSAPASTAKGAITLAANGGFTYRPTVTARHTASALTATSAEKTDTFTVTIKDDHGGTTAAPVTVAIAPANKNPVASAVAGTPNSATGLVSGTVSATDADSDPLVYKVSASTAKGTVAVGADGRFTYTPTSAARHAAAKLTATPADRTDAFTITVSDGHGGSVAVPVSVAITPSNAAPTATPKTSAPDATTGVVAGALLGADTDGDVLGYSGSGSTAKGKVVVNADGSFTYTPTVTARHLAAFPTAQADGTDTFTVTVADGYGGTVTVPVNVAVSPASVTFNFVYGTGSQYWTPEARSALQAAATRLSSRIVVDKPVTVTYDVVGDNTPGSGWIGTSFTKFGSSGPGYYGTVVQTKILTGKDVNGSASDSQISMNFAYPWALGDTVGASQYDFQAVATHELVHTLGVMTALGDPAGIDSNWTTYDRYLATAGGTPVIGGDYVWNSAYTPNLTGGNGGLYFAGPNAVAVYGGPVPLYTPAVWKPGSSLTHLDPADAPPGTVYLMDPTDVYGSGVRVLTPVDAAMLTDLGYTVYQPVYALFFIGFGFARRRRG